MTNRKRARAGSFLLIPSGVLFAMGVNLRFKRVLLFSVLLYSETMKTAHGRNLAHCGRYYPAQRSELDAIREQYHGTPGRIAARQKRPRAHEGVRVAKVARVGKSGKSKVARESLESRKSRKSALFQSRSKVESRYKVESRESFESRKSRQSRKSIKSRCQSRESR